MQHVAGRGAGGHGTRVCGREIDAAAPGWRTSMSPTPDLTGAEAPARAAQCGRGSTSRPACAGWGVFSGFHAWVGTRSSRPSTSFRFVSLIYKRSVNHAGEGREPPDRPVASDFFQRIQARMRQPAHWTRSWNRTWMPLIFTGLCA